MLGGLFSKIENGRFFSVPERKSIAVIIGLSPVAVFDLCAEGFEFVEAPKKGGHGDTDAAGKSVVAAGGFVVYKSVHATEQFEVFDEGHTVEDGWRVTGWRVTGYGWLHARRVSRKAEPDG